MTRPTEWMLRGVLLALFVGLATRYLGGASPVAEKFAFWALFVGVFVWAAVALVRQALSILYFGKGRYSVLVFVLDEQKRVLLVQHPYHKRLIPPGGRLRVLEVPHEAVTRVLHDEANLTWSSIGFWGWWLAECVAGIAPGVHVAVPLPLAEQNPVGFFDGAPTPFR